MSIGVIRMKLLELQDNNKETKKLKTERQPKGYENIEKVFYYQSLTYTPKIIYSKLISRHYNNLLAGHFGMEKT